MSRSRSRRSSYTQRRRVTVANANRRLPQSVAKNISLDNNEYLLYTGANAIALGELYGEVEDRRRWNPEGSSAAAASFDSPRHRLRAFQSRRSTRIQGSTSVPFGFGGLLEESGVAFRRPSRVLVCVRRRIRREVMHAFGKAGKVGQKRPRRGPYSSVRC